MNRKRGGSITNHTKYYPRLPLCLAEIVWRFNNGKDCIQLQEKLILIQLERCHG